MEPLEDRTLLATVNWINPAGGDWDTAGNWSGNAVPGPGDDVQIEIAVTNPITHSAVVTDSIQSLTATDPVNLSGGTLNVATTLSSSVPFTLAGGTLGNATVAAGTTIEGSSSGGGLTAVVLNGNLDLASASGFVDISGGLTLNGTISLGNASGTTAGFLRFNGTQTLGGNGSIVFGAAGGGSNHLTVASGTLTLAPGFLILGQNGQINGSFVNQGTITADTAGGTITLVGTWSNSGSLEALNGGTLTLGSSAQDTWSNTGTITQTNATLNLGGTVTTAGLGTITRNGGTVNLTGALNNTNSTLTLNSTTGPWKLLGGVINGGTVTEAGGDFLLPTSASGTLSGVTLNGDLDMASNSGIVGVSNGFTLNGTAYLGNASATTSSHINFAGNQTLGGSGSIVFGSATGGGNRLTVQSGTLTLAPGFLIHGQNGVINGSFVNQGTIAADTANGTVALTGAWSNSGSLEAQNGGTLTLGGSAQDTWSNTGTISQTNSTLNIGGTITAAGLGTITRSGGTVNLIAVLNNAGNTLTLNSTTGPWNLDGGLIEGGTVTEVGGTFLQPTNSGGELTGVVLNGNLDLASESAHLDIGSGGLTLNGTANLGNASGTTSGVLRFDGTQTLGGSGSIVFGSATGGANNLTVGSGTLTLPQGFLIHGQSGAINGSFVNQGTIDADTSGGTFLLSGSWSSSGAIEAQPGTTLYLGLEPSDTWSNTGPITVNSSTLNLNGTWSNTNTITQIGSTVNLGGTFTTAGLGAIASTNGLVNLTGTLTNNGTLALSNSTGPLYLAGGTINGGTVTTTGSAALIASPPYQSTLNGITLAGTLDDGFTGGNRVTVTGGLTLNNGSIVLEGFGLLSFKGSQTLGGTGTVSFADSDSRKDVAVPNTGDTLTIGPGISISGAGGTIGSQNAGLVTVSGSVQVNGGGTILVYGATNYSGGTFTGGTWQAIQNSTLELIGDSITSNAANLLVDGASSAINSDQNGTNALANLVSNAATGNLAIQDGYTFQAPAAFTNTGTVTVGASAQFKLSSSYTQTKGSTNLAAGTLGSSPSNSVTIQSGALSGPGTINASLVNDGAMDLGTSPGTVTVAGNYTQGANASLSVKLGGTTAGSQYDQVNVTGSAGLNGALNISLVNGFGPTAGQTFQTLTFASRSGNFATINGLVQNNVTTMLPVLNSTNFTLKAVTTAPDLAPQSVTLPSGTQVPGQPITISFQVANLGGTALSGNWVDSVFLSTSTSLDANAIPIGQAQHTGGLAVNSGYAGSLTAALPGVINGNYFVLVEADSQMLTPDSNRNNNVLASASPLAVAIPALTPGTPVSGTIADGQDVYYQVVTSPGRDEQLTAAFPAPSEADFGVGYFKVPTRSTFDLSYPKLSDLTQNLILPGAVAGTYYILLHGETGAGNGEPFTLEARSAPFQIQSFTSSPGPAAGQTSLEIVGSAFTPHTTVELLDAQNNAFKPVNVTFVGSDQVVATFNLGTLLQGSYKVRAIDGANVAIAPTLFNNLTVGPGTAHLDIFTAPAEVAVAEPAAAWVQVSNPTNNPILAPTLQFTGTNATLAPQLPGDAGQVREISVQEGPSTGFKHVWRWWGAASNTLTIYPSGAQGGLIQSLAPNGSYGGHFAIFPSPDAPDTTCTIGLALLSGGSQIIDWAGQENALRPSTIQPDAWHAIYANFTAALGNTLGSMQQVFASDSTYLAELGENVIVAPQLAAFELMKADDSLPSPFLSSAVDAAFPALGLPLTFGRTYVGSLSGRYHLSTLGRGWVSNWDISASTDNAGDVIVQDAGTFRLFTRLLNGTYQAQPGDQGRLTLTSGTYQLREKDGAVTAFLPNGQFNYVQDANGNRVTAGYTNGLLTSVMHSDGDQLTISYNAQGLISQVIDPAGRVASYTYDAGGQHLISVTTPAGTTQYAYITGQGIAHEHALETITFPGGKHLYFSYDAQGRLSGSQADNGNNLTSYTYFPIGGYSVTDADNYTTTVLYDVNGRPGAVTDALGNVSFVRYDADGQPVLISQPGGPTSSLSYDRQGNVSQLTDPLGNTTHFTSNAQFGGLQSFTSPLGATTNYGYTDQGDLASITQPDGSASQYTYNSRGQVVQSIDAMGRVTDYTYNARGQLVQRANPDGTSIVLGCDTFGNLVSVTDASGTISMSYDSDSRLVEVRYPNGDYLKYSYDAAGRRTQIVDQTGFTENYAYNSAGELVQVTDAGGALIASYTYDPDGQLVGEQRGNGTSTTYGYDADGQLLHLVNYAPDNSVNSRFDYTYDSLGHVTSMTTLGGTTDYGYDADGGLISVVLPGGRTITYAYDAMGNRTVVSDSGGVTTDYATNELNQYTAVGAASYSYDANGNLTVTTGPGGTSTYTYDDRNRLVGVQTATDTWSYRYDALGDLVAATHNGQTTQYLVDPTGLGSVVGEYDGSGNLIANFTYGFGLTSQVSANRMAAYYDFDATGNTAGLSGQTGDYLNSYSYLPFGEILSTSGSLANPFQYNGQLGVMAQGNGLNFMRDRFYAPAQGRFLNRDPIGLSGGSNVYTFAGNNPISSSDPSGLIPWPFGPGFPATPENAKILDDALTRPLDFGETPADALLDAPADIALQEIGDQGLRINPSPFANGVSTLGGVSAAEFEAAQQYAASVIATQAVLEEANANLGGLLSLIAEPTDPGPNSGKRAISFFGIFELLGEQLYWLNRETLPVPVVTAADVASFTVTVVGPQDPNFISGPAGFGTQRFVPTSGVLPYDIDFTNEANASAPAQVVTVTQQLDPNLDWSTFQLGDFGFGGQTYQIPPGLQDYSTRIDARSTVGVYVDVTADFNAQSGRLTWTFTSIDPTTLAQPSGNPLEGFLPPNVTAPQGQGWVTYSVLPKASDPTDTMTGAQATVLFDQNAPINTQTFSNTIDAGPPTSSVQALPATETSTSFTVNWSGHDDPGGSGIASFDVYVSDNGGAFTLWQGETTATSATFTGVAGHTYAFYSVATDNVGNVQPTPTAAQATTDVITQQPATLSAVSGSGTYAGKLTLTGTLTSSGTPVPNGPVSFVVTVGGASTTFGPANTGANGVATLTVSLPAGIDAGTFTGAVAASFAGDQIYQSASGTGDLIVAKAQATLSLSNLAATYDGQAHFATVTTGPAGLSGVTVTYILNGAAVASPTTAGSYAVDASLTNPDYQATDATGTLVISPATPLVTWSNPADIVYGTALGSSQLDAIASVPGTFAYTPAAGTVLHAGQGQTLSAVFSPADSTDYLSVNAQAVLNVTPAPLTITADNESKIYGAALPALTVTYAGLVNGDTPGTFSTSPNTAPTVTTTATAASHLAGSPYTNTASGAVDPDYNISYVNGSLTITAAPLTITADNQSKVYGAALPALTVTYTGLVNGDTPATFSASPNTAPTLTTTATAASHVGGNPYAITGTGAADSDYTITYAPGTLTITAAPLTITADNQSKVYGAALPALTASYSGFVNGDTTASLATQPSLSTTATAASHVSGNPYSITASGAVDADYSISYVARSLTVTQAALTITADNKTKAYGAPLPTLTASYAGFVNGDTSASVSTPPTLSTTATAASHVAGSPFTITATGAADADYSISYLAGSLTVTPAALTITANNQIKVYGAALPALTASYSGFVNGDTPGSLTTPPSLSTTATASSHVSGNPYTITASGAVDSDYSFSYVAGSLTVTPAALTITANNQSKVYGAALPTLTASYSGFVNGDTPSSLTTKPSLSTTATASSHVSGNPYTITASGTVDSDYTIGYAAGTLTITPAALTITADNKSKVYGAPLPALTASYSGFVNGDTAASLAVPATLSTTATPSSPVSGSPYGISVSGAVDSDYGITYATGTLTVTAAASATSVSSSTGGTSSSGAGVTFTARVTSSGPPTVDEGSVSFYFDASATAFSTVPVSGGTATSATISTLSVGSHTIRAVYSDGSVSPNILGSSASTSQTVVGNQIFTVVTSGGLAQFDTDPTVAGNQFNLVYVQNSGSGYEMVTSNPGQFYDNAFFSGTPGTSVTLTLTVPFPFITQGSVPTHVYSGYTLSGATPAVSVVPGTDVTSSFTITSAGGNKTASGAAAIVLGDYSPQNMGSTTTVTVTGLMPSTGTMYVGVHLAFGLTTTAGWTLGTSYSVGGNTYIDAVNSGLGVTVHAPAGSGTYANGQPYQFSVATGGTVLGTDAPYSENIFKKSVGAAGTVVQMSNGLPVVGAALTLYGPNSSTAVAATATTDANGAYYLNYKYTGSAATFIVQATCGTWSQKQTITLKANAFQIVNFVDGNAQLVGGWSKSSVGTTQLTQAGLEPVLAKAKSYWASHGVLPAQLRALAGARVEIVDLPPGLLGQLVAGTNVIQISRNGAGLGWFTDPQASPPAGAFDLLTVVVHEMGHLLGLSDVDRSGEVESTYLAPSVRQLSTSQPVERLSASVTLPLRSTVEARVFGVAPPAERNKNLEALDAILAEWVSSDETYGRRWKHIHGID
jgi:RHS repeat-associated protein